MTLTPLAQSVLDDGTKITKMERDAMNRDSTVLAAKAKLDERSCPR